MNPTLKSLQKIINRLVTPAVNDLIKNLNLDATIKIDVLNTVSNTEDSIGGFDFDIKAYYVNIYWRGNDELTYYSSWYLCRLILDAGRYIISDYFAIRTFVYINGKAKLHLANTFFSSGDSYTFEKTLDEFKKGLSKE